MSTPKPFPADEARALLHAGRAAWIFDFDGTLVDLAERPDAVVVPDPLLENLDALSRQCQGRVAIVSGRGLADLETLLPLSALTLVGNHGVERRTAGSTSVSAPNPSVQRQLDRLRPQLMQLAAQFPGLLVEDKRWTVSVHVRSLPESEHAAVAEQLTYLTHKMPELAVKPAVRCWEIRPAQGTHKGEAVAWLRELWGPVPVPLGFGDDVTDEDLFGALPDGLTTIVGSRRPTRARFALPNPAALRALLRFLI